ncbi:MAG: holo-ACP synthase [Rhizobiales bacterium TMED94]|nr:holo-ACP synthase [Rhodobiaceae bacterium]RPF86033.1 MAG: holo-ACP synthase [Rhizobiales bacterium TMED94]|tara:strand:+ start:2137 stop:2535 length:399 start_codon:yes stop_codon:yes gene_type:complete
MIIGHGIDLIDIRRVEKTINKFGNRFINRIFTKGEIIRSDNRNKRIESYAKRFAAKEACSKALGTGFRSGVYWRDIEVINEKSGKPILKLTGGALKRLEKLITNNNDYNISLSITDDYPWAQANVIIEVVEK